MWLLDTNVLSEIRRLKPERKVLAFTAGYPLDELYVSVVTLAELRFGIGLLTVGSARRGELDHWLTHTIRPMFDQCIAGYGGHHVQVESSAGRRPESRPHLLLTRSDHRRDRSSPRPDGGDQGSKRLRQGGRTGSQSLGGVRFPTRYISSFVLSSASVVV